MMMQAPFCLRPNGVRFLAPAGTTEFTKRWEPKPGDIVSYKHRGYMAGSHKPKLPTLYRIRDDLSWEDIVNNWKEDATLKGNAKTFMYCYFIVTVFSCSSPSLPSRARKGPIL